MSDTTRVGTAREFAAVTNAQVHIGDDVIANVGRMDFPHLTLPEATAPLHDHLDFVGRVVEAMAPCVFDMWISPTGFVRVRIGDALGELGDGDVSLAAMLAVIKAKKAERP